jgi:hypothetical protein
MATATKASHHASRIRERKRGGAEPARAGLAALADAGARLSAGALYLKNFQTIENPENDARLYSKSHDRRPGPPDCR